MGAAYVGPARRDGVSGSPCHAARTSDALIEAMIPRVRALKSWDRARTRRRKGHAGDRAAPREGGATRTPVARGSHAWRDGRVSIAGLREGIFQRPAALTRVTSEMAIYRGISGPFLRRTSARLRSGDSLIKRARIGVTVLRSVTRRVEDDAREICASDSGRHGRHQGDPVFADGFHPRRLEGLTIGDHPPMHGQVGVRFYTRSRPSPAAADRHPRGAA